MSHGTQDTGEATAAGHPAPAELLRLARKTYRNEIGDARGGARAAEVFSTRVDEILQLLHTRAAHPAAAVALVAIGGYGRRQLCLHSDLDLLFLFDGEITTAEKQFVTELLHPLWDLGLDIGQQVRQLDELGEAQPDNPEFLVALRDARFLAGDTGSSPDSTPSCAAPNPSGVNRRSTRCSVWCETAIVNSTPPSISSNQT